MKICGIEIKGSEALIAVAELNGDEISHVAIETKRVALQDDEDADHIRSFSALINGLVRDNGIHSIAIKKRNKKGEFAGGPVTFKIEGIIQLTSNCSVKLISPPTISATNKSHGFTIPGSLNKYQHEAFLTACTMIVKFAK